MDKKLDEIDLKLIALLQENARYSLKQLAQAVFLSSPAVSTRLEQLEKNGVILGYKAQVNPLKLGYHIKAYINLELAPEQKPIFYPFAEACPNVIECDCVTGQYSVLLKVLFPSTVDLDIFIGQLQKYGHTQTQIVFSTPVEARNIVVNIPD